MIEKSPTMRFLRTFAVTFGALVTVGIAFLGGYVLGSERAPALGPGFDVLVQAQAVLSQNYYGDLPSAQAQAYGAVRGLVESYNDPFTIFEEPGPRRLEQDKLAGSFGGIGVSIQRNVDGDVILTPMVDGPAARAGVLDGDVLIAVDAQPITASLTSDQIALRLRGDIGTAVTLELRRAGRTAPFSVRITREQIVTPSVDWRVLDAQHHIGYVRISIFDQRTSEELQAALAALSAQATDRLVLDLRGNGGGLLDAGVDTASQFLPNGIVLREVRRGGTTRSYAVRSGVKPAVAWPIAVLTDGGTASASEIVAGALHDYGRALLVGEKTYGKGSAQEVHELSDGSSLHVTVAEWLTPNGHQIDKTGLEPDIPVTPTAQDRSDGRDPQLARAEAWLSGPVTATVTAATRAAP
jgi:carboxyl-terminal processing protease